MSSLISQLTVGFVLTTVGIVIHISGLLIMIKVLKWLTGREAIHPGVFKSFLLLLFSALFILFVHIIGIWFWALFFLANGVFENLEQALYFSTVTATTLGYGDVILEPGWRLLGSFHGMTGIILFGVSTAFFISVFRKLLLPFIEDDK